MAKVHEFRIGDIAYATIQKTAQGCYKTIFLGNNEEYHYPTLKAAKAFVLKVGDTVCEYMMQENAKKMALLEG